MGKPTSGGGGSTIFTSRIDGPPPGPLLVASEEWIELMVIPVGKRIWFGSGIFGSPDKLITFEIWTNNAGQSAGDVNSGTRLGAATAKNTTKYADFYQRGRLHLVSVIGTGVEKCWLRLKSKGSPGSYLYTITYTDE